MLLHLQQAVQNGFILLEVQQLLQLAGVLPPAGADAVVDQGGELGIAGLQPPAEGNAVGFVVEFLRVNVVKRLQLGVFQNLGMESGHAVDREAAVDVHVGHVNAVLPVDDGDPGIGMGLLHAAVQLLDDGHQLGGHLLDKGQGPLLQSLGQDGVVGVGAGAADLIQGGVKGQALGGEQPDQLGDDHGGVGVVDLDHHMVGQGVGGVPPALQLGEDQLGPGGHHEILLIHPEQPPRVVAVVGVEEGGQPVGDVPLVKVDAHPGGGGGLGHVEEVEPVGALVVGSGDGDVVEHRLQVETAEGDVEGAPGGDEPAVRLHPGVRDLGLAVVVEFLPEEAVVVVQAHAVAGQAQGGDGVQEAGGQTAQTAVAQGGLWLHGLDDTQVPAQVGQQGANLVVESQGQQVVGQELAHEELGGEIVELPSA